MVAAYVSVNLIWGILWTERDGWTEQRESDSKRRTRAERGRERRDDGGIEGERYRWSGARVKTDCIFPDLQRMWVSSQFGG